MTDDQLSITVFAYLRMSSPQTVANLTNDIGDCDEAQVARVLVTLDKERLVQRRIGNAATGPDAVWELRQPVLHTEHDFEGAEI